MKVHRVPKKRRVLILVENLPSPFDRRVWQEATTLHHAGYEVTIICPTAPGYEARHEVLDGIHIYRFNLPFEAEGALAYAVEYAAAMFWMSVLSWKVLFKHGFDAIHACNPPDLLFIIGGFFKLVLGKRFLFDHHDVNPELYEAKFGRRDAFWKMMVWLERLTFRCADVSIATNESYRDVAIERGGMPADKVFVVRSGPNLSRLRRQPPNPLLRKGRRHLVGYVGVMGKQEGIEHLLHAAKHIVFVLGRNDVHFGLVGSGTSIGELKALCAALGLDEHVTFTGRVPDPEMLDMLNTADVCVNADVFNALNDKSTMNKVMEYMALGKPIVQFELREGRFSAQEASLYARPNDSVDMAVKIVELLDDPLLRETMGNFGRQRVEQALEWRYEAPKLLAAYDALFADAGGTTAS